MCFGVYRSMGSWFMILKCFLRVELFVVSGGWFYSIKKVVIGWINKDKIKSIKGLL